MVVYMRLHLAAAMGQHNTLLPKRGKILNSNIINYCSFYEMTRQQEFILYSLLGRDNRDRHGTQLSGQKGTGH